MHEAGCEEVLALLGEGGGDTGSLPHPNLTKEIISGVHPVSEILDPDPNLVDGLLLMNSDSGSKKNQPIRTFNRRSKGFNKGFDFLEIQADVFYYRTRRINENINKISIEKIGIKLLKISC